MLSLSPWSLTLALTSHVLSANAVPTISAVGSKFFYDDGRQYFLKGIAYQRTPEDPLIDTAQCERDIARMAELGTNAIRVYHVDPAANHDGCMNALADAGIYLFLDLDTFDTSIRQDTPSWTQTQFTRYKEVLDAFHQYPNTAGFLVGNEVLSTEAGAPAAPYILAATRDLKSYRNERNYRAIPIGYTAADIAELRPMLQNYLACRPDPSERLDFFGLNAYEWCGSDASYETSGYSNLQSQAESYPIPIFFSETGCNAARPRTFDDQAAIFGPHMLDTWSGSIIYEWIQEANDYGLISYGPHVDDAPATGTLVQDGFTRQGTPTPVQPDFDNLKAQWETLTPTGVALSEYVKSTGTIKPAECPAATAGGWDVDPKAPLPTLGETFHRAAGGAAVAPKPTAGNAGGSGSTADAGAGAGAGGKTGVDPVHGSNSGENSASSPSDKGNGGATTSGPTSTASGTGATGTSYDTSSAGHALAAPNLHVFGDVAMLVCVTTGVLALWL